MSYAMHAAAAAAIDDISYYALFATLSLSLPLPRAAMPLSLMLFADTPLMPLFLFSLYCCLLLLAFRHTLLIFR